MWFSPYLSVWRGGKAALRGLKHNLLMQFSTLYSSKNGNFSNRFFFYIPAIHNDQISFVQHVLKPL